MNKQAGFTLFELLLVISLFVITAAIAIPSIISWRNAAVLRGTAENIKGDLQLAKTRAIRQGTPVSVTFNPTNYQISFTDAEGNVRTLRDQQLRPGVVFDLDETSFVNMDDEMQFNSRGIPVAGTAVLVNSAGDKKSIVVSALGRIRVE
jgi:type IV fimbrial biogenesis protein FimT